MYSAGVIGLGRMGAEPSKRLEGKVPNGWLPISHLEAILATKDATLTAISDVSEERMHWVNDYYDLQVQQFQHAKELIKQQPDILTIATRTQERYDLLLDALEHNIKAIVVEKPLANSIRRTEEIIRKVKERGCLLGYGAARRAMDIYCQARDIIASGDIGSLQSIVAEFGYSRLLWSLPHAVDLFLFFANDTKIDFVSGHCTLEKEELTENQYDGDPLVETATVRFTNGIVANIIPSNGLNIRLGCTGGTLTIHGDGDYIEINRPDKFSAYFTGTKRIENHYINSGICNIYTGIVESLKNKTQFQIICPEEIEVNQKILSGIVQSSIQGGRRLPLDALNENFFITGRIGKLFA